MKVLIVTNTLPFPPLNGKELPIARLFEKISINNKVDLLVLEEKKTGMAKPVKLPSTINFIGYLPVKKISLIRKLFTSILTLKHSISPYNYSLVKIKNVIGDKDYDYIWVSPVTYYSFINFCITHKIRFFKKIVIGLNDAKTYQYRDSINEFLHSKVFKLRYITVWLRSFLLQKEEKRFLALADIVHVQTQSECQKVKKIIPAPSKIKVVVAANGIKEELFACNYNGIDSNFILYMTHLFGDRKKESEWFIKKVWKIIKESLPHAKLLLVGTPPKQPIEYIKDDKNIIVHGYAEDMISLFNSVRLAVVPTFHGTGLINRILDALTAGVPVVSTPQAIATFTGIKVGKEILAGNNVKSFAQEVINLYNKRQFRLTVAENGKQFARQCATWQQSANIIQNEMAGLLQS
jgi:glycosyltransferase involved in cell wall biosynthesis